MKRTSLLKLVAACVIFGLPSVVLADDVQFPIGHLLPDMRVMIGKPLLDQTIDFNNRSSFVLVALTPEGSRFFYGGNKKEAGETADDMRQKHGFVIILTPCPDTHDFASKIESISLWETLDAEEPSRMGAGMEQLLAMMNTPPGVVTPSVLRAPKVKSFHGPVFEYVRGDTTETLSLLNEGSPLRLNWTISNTGICPHK